MLVEQWMSREPITTTRGATVAEAYRTMNEVNIRRLPVVEDGALVGIVTKTDLLAAFGKLPGEQYDRAMKKKVGNVMTKAPKTIVPTATLDEAAAIMHDHKIASLPVLEGGTLVGILTETDVFKAFLDILGVGSHAPRLTFTFKSAEELLDRLQEKLPNRAQIHSLVTYEDRKAKNWQAVVRIRARRK